MNGDALKMVDVDGDGSWCADGRPEDQTVDGPKIKRVRTLLLSPYRL